MSVSLALLQIMAMAIGSANQQGLPVREESPDRNSNVQTVYMNDSHFFYRAAQSSPYYGFTEANYGPFYLFTLFEYLDLMKNDGVIAEANDYIAYISGPTDPVYTASPINLLASPITYADYGLGWLETFLTNQSLVYSPSNNSNSSQLPDDGFWFYGIYNYLLNRGFTVDTSASPGDFSIYYGQGSYSVDNGMDGEWDTPYEMIVDAVDNNYPCIFTVNGSDSECAYPHFAIGYEETTFHNVILNIDIVTYEIIGFTPHFGIRYISPDKIVKASALDFHPTHVHSNNLYSSSLGHSYCGCWQITGCDNHDYHYTRLNNLVHRKTCSMCGESSIEHHFGNYCICQLGDM